MFGKHTDGEAAKKRHVVPAKIILAAALTLAVGLTPALAWNLTPVNAASSLSDLKNKQAQIQQQQKNTQATIDRLKKEASDQQAQKEALDTQLSNVQQEVDVITEQINALNAQITQKEAEIADKQKDIDATFDQLKERIRALYLMGDATILESLLNAEDATSFAENAEIARSITEHDAAIIDNLKTQLAEIADEKKIIEDNKTEVAAQKNVLEQKKAQVQELLEESAAVMAKIRQQTSEAQSKQADLEKQEELTNSEIDRVIAEQQRLLEEQRKKQQQSGGGSNGGAGNVNYAGTGNFTWPCPGVTKITSYWGDGRGHKALDIAGAGAYGKTIVASDGGKVVGANYSGWGGGYGLYVLIDHGNGYSTIYGHCSSVNVSVGQVVSKGQAIAHIGSTGDSTGPHLHFEVRRNGVKIDPLQFFQ